ncbi:hypothetical protein PF002_g22320 [Phytophthora fragariae]|uniref:Uncharacterized protein n=1 Tax=Phytophthora fragariae TaxID=53985 RepID=A0A6A3X9N9_9STRA|nr:hypothetical protein PF002_g22320 [Phytophthora fragariae]
MEWCASGETRVEAVAKELPMHLSNLLLWPAAGHEKTSSCELLLVQTEFASRQSLRIAVHNIIATSPPKGASTIGFRKLCGNYRSPFPGSECH